MREAVIRASALWGLLAVGFHLVLSTPFFFLGPMLTTPSHSGVIGWFWFVLEFPAIASVMLLRLNRLALFGGSVLGEFAGFVVYATVFWFLLGFVGALAFRLIWR